MPFSPIWAHRAYSGWARPAKICQFWVINWGITPSQRSKVSRMYFFHFFLIGSWSHLCFPSKTTPTSFVTMERSGFSYGKGNQSLTLFLYNVDGPEEMTSSMNLDEILYESPESHIKSGLCLLRLKWRTALYSCFLELRGAFLKLLIALLPSFLTP